MIHFHNVFKKFYGIFFPLHLEQRDVISWIQSHLHSFTSFDFYKYRFISSPFAHVLPIQQKAKSGLRREPMEGEERLAEATTCPSLSANVLKVPHKLNE